MCKMTPIGAGLNLKNFILISCAVLELLREVSWGGGGEIRSLPTKRTMLNMKTKFRTSQIPGEEIFSKPTNTSSWEGSDHAKYQQSQYPLIKFMLFISIHKIEGRYWKYGCEILRQKT